MPFIPPVLPPADIDYVALIPFISKANKALGELQGLLINIPNHQLLTTPLITKEAVLSSKIEGTHASLSDVYKYEAEDKNTQANSKERDAREILNYRKAVYAAVEELKNKPIGEGLIKKIHYILLDSVRGENKNRGNLRRMQVYVGRSGGSMDDAIYIPPPITELGRLLSNWEKYINSKEEKDPLVQIGIAHYQFEAIHPFMDGNGRIGRLLIPLFLFANKYLPYPMLYISEYFEAHNKDYRKYLHLVDEESDWTCWLKFFLTALEHQALKTQITAVKMLELYDKSKQQLSSVNSVYAISLLDILFDTPVITFSNIKKRLRTNSYQTIYNIINKFIKLELLVEISGRQRNRMFAFKKLIKIL